MRLIVSVAVFCQGTFKIQYLFYPLSAMILHPSPYGFYTCKFYLRLEGSRLPCWDGPRKILQLWVNGD